MSRSRDLADSGSKANFLDNVSTDLGDFSGQSIPHIIPGILHPAVEGKDLAGDTLPGSYVYGTAHTDNRKYYYTDIKGSKPIKDPRIGGHFGSQRHKFKSLQLLEQETATHGSNVYSLDGREWIRAYGDWVLFNNSAGVGIYTDGGTSNHGYLEITGYFSDVNMIGVTLTSNRGYVYAIDGASYSAEQTTFETSVNTPLGSRFVDYFSLANVVAGQTLGIHTISFRSHAVGDYFEVGGCELIAQDTSNRNNIQIPSQDVVSYGKKFTVSGTPHYNPFNNQAIGDTTSHGKNTVGWTTYDSTLDTATSLGLDAWVDSGNYYRPVNGGRIIKWVDSSGNIKTSVNMMPPSAKALGSHSGNSGPHQTAWTSTYKPVFSSGSVDHTQAEVAKMFHFREFGNGGANGNASYKDLSVIGYENSSDTIAYVMDDGLTSASGSAYITTSGRLDWDASDFIYFTFIGTGFGRNAASNLTFAQNLPYGSHIVKINISASSPWYTTITVDGVSLGTTFPSDYYSADDITFHQPKKPPIPEDACVLADYMLMADFVPVSANGGQYISKGVRGQALFRDIFADANASYDAFSSSHISAGHSYGYRLVAGSNANSPTSTRVRLPSFATNFVARAYQFGTRHDLYIDTTIQSSNQTIENSPSSTAAYDTYAYLTSAQNLGVYNFGFNAKNGQALNASSLEIATPIHTSSHYQTFETPYLHELIGGDRNMEQTNLVCSPDGKTWDQITRDTSYIGNIVGSANHDGGKDWPDIWMMNNWRGTDDGRASQNYVQKDFAIAYDRIIFLRSGQYKFDLLWTSNGGGEHFTIMKNGVQCGLAYIGLSGDANSNSWFLHLQRGDYVQVKGSWGTDKTYNGFFVERC